MRHNNLVTRDIISTQAKCVTYYVRRIQNSTTPETNRNFKNLKTTQVNRILYDKFSSEKLKITTTKY